MLNKLGYLLIVVLAVIMFVAPKLKAQSVVAGGSTPEAVTKGYQFTEGPYWHPDGYLLFSDIPSNTIYKWTPGSEEAQAFVKPSGHSNGIASDHQGNLIIAQHDGMVSKINSEQKVVVLASSYEGKRLNSPNDLTVSEEGIIYFTDPPFGVSEDDQELTFSGVYMLNPEGRLTLLYDGFSRPNGIELSPDESKLYVNDSESGQILVFDRKEDGLVGSPMDFASVGEGTESGAADGLTVDQQGRVYSTGPKGVYVFSPEGKQLQIIDLPARVTNMGWGGESNKMLYFTTPSTIYRLNMQSRGVN